MRAGYGQRPAASASPFSPGDACVQGTDRAIGVIYVQPRRLGRVERQELPLPASASPSSRRSRQPRLSATLAS